MSSVVLAGIFFIYGLAFFCMGLVTSLETTRASSSRLRRALQYLAAFGIIHGIHEWYEVVLLLELVPDPRNSYLLLETVRIGLLVLSFLPLSSFGIALIVTRYHRARWVWLGPLLQLAIWGLVVVIALPSQDPMQFSSMADVLARYTLAIPGSLLAAAGLRMQCVRSHREGLPNYGHNCSWAAISFLLYGVIGQLFVRETSLPLSSLLNQEGFLDVFGFPVQLLRAGAAVLIALFILRFLRTVEKEVQQNVRQLQEERIKASQQREALRGDLLKRVVGAQEAERQRIARELHDETGQALTAVGMGLQGLQGRIAHGDSQVRENIQSLQDLVTHSILELQHIISDLRPSHLDDLGLRATLRWYAGMVSERAQLEITVATRGEELPMASASKMALFRLAQEAITNVVKHAQASKVRVDLTYTERGVVLTVNDDGCGFDLPRIQQRKDNWGLLGMFERASLMGGEFKIESEPAMGTLIEAYIPYHAVEDDQNGNTIIVGG